MAKESDWGETWVPCAGDRVLAPLTAPKEALRGKRTGWSPGWGDDLADGRVVRNEVGKAQAPGAPVAAHLTDDEFSVSLGLEDGLVDLFEGIDIFVIYLFQRRLGLNG